MAFINGLLNFILTYKWVLLFYLLIAVIIILNKKKFQVESGFIFLYRTDFGIRWINKFADKHKEFVKIVGNSAIGVGFLGMIVISGYIIKGMYELLFVPLAPPTMSLVIPGIQIPGSPIFIPFWYGIIALFIVVVFHEFGHGIVARANGLKIKNTGIVFFGPLIGAFVEPDEKNLVKKDSVVQQSIFASGPFFNGILAVFAAILLLLVLNPITSTMVTETGISFNQLQEGYPAQKYGIEQNVPYTTLNGIPIKNSQHLTEQLSCVKPNETITIGNANKTITLITAPSPKDSTKGYIGIYGITDNYELKSQVWWYKGIYYILYFLINLTELVVVLSLGIGLANLLPLGPVDGGRMLHKALINTNGKDKGIKIWLTISLITLALILILIFAPIIKSIFFKM
jgi:membrane-associated protease RseP (regulator of RpoE activity)